MFFTSTPSATVAEVARQVVQPHVAFIDVRTPHEYHMGHAHHAKNIPLDVLSERDVERLKRAETVYVICRSGGRSAQGVKMLISAGVNAINVSGGTMAWQASGLPMGQ